MEVAVKRVADEEEQAIDHIEIECEPCKGEHVATTANGICRDCDEYMCSTCFRHHLKAKQCRNHVLIDKHIAHKSAENVEKCQHHANEQIKFYCRTHEIVGCGECMIPDHRGCKTENIKGLAKEFAATEDFKRLMKKLNDLEMLSSENDTAVLENKNANKSMYECALKDIRTFRNDVNSCLDNAEEYIAKEAKDIENQNSKLLVKLEHDCQLLSSKIEQVKQKLDPELYPENALFIQTVNCKPIIHDIERAVSKVQKENYIREFEFIPDKQLQNLISSIKNFGKIYTCTPNHTGHVRKSFEISEEREKIPVPIDEPMRQVPDVKRQERASVETIEISDEREKVPTTLEEYVAKGIEVNAKVIIIGETFSGKTSLLTRYVEDTFTDEDTITLGVDRHVKCAKYSGKIIKIEIWDTPSHTNFKTLFQSHYRRCHGAIIVFDVTRRASFEGVEQWVNDVKRYTPDSTPMLLIGNKCDLATGRCVTNEEAKSVAVMNDMDYIETSAKTNYNVEEAFEILLTNIYKKVYQQAPPKENVPRRGPWAWLANKIA